MSAYSVRLATIGDSPQIASLLTALGHDSTENQVRDNWREFTTAGNIALVAESEDGAIIGVITVHRMTVLHRPKPVGRITALYVCDTFRNRGIGRELVARAESELKQLGCGLVEITSNFRLTKAHTFYERLGYTQTSVRLAKAIPQGLPK